MSNICISERERLMDCVFIRAVDAADLSRTSGSSGLMRSAVLCFCNFSRQGQSLFNLLGKDEPVCPREVLDIFLCGATPFLLLSNYDWQGFPRALCWVRVELCLEIACTSRPGTFFFFFPKSGSVPSCDTAVYKRAACQALHMCICYSSTCHVTKQLIQSWYYSISWRNAKLGGSVDRKALCTLILI